ncbi:hypothetical protein [Aquiflexum gelatinilyticum]|uniref:Outer membrane protein beta-barrel domain-containing protein n=1 Tax=Aquiflexum gelatinilyticum TaxID=2961943 RepID=A0A9X2SZI6_9BACT|nr:hypothetical protein [Aquiflexum gelatinilyticum]MCR9014523.1 hypothetical protein [Aquiflexum gelatinilyticum]
MKCLRRILFLAILPFVITISVNAQDLTFLDLDAQVQSAINNGEWLRVLELAKSQIKSDVEREEGYYYSALAFYNLGKNKMAKPYMNHLRKMDQTELDPKIKELHDRLNSGENKGIKETFFLNYDPKKGIRLYDRSFLSFSYDSKLPFGIAVGSINHHGIATYLQVRGNSEILTKSGEITVRSNGNIYGTQNKDSEATGKIRKGTAEFVMGVTWKIHQPLWWYAGAGLNHSREFWEVTIFEENGNSLGEIWARNTEINLNQALVESGFILDFNGFNLRGGTSLVGFDFSKIRYNMGIGFSFKRK